MLAVPLSKLDAGVKTIVRVNPELLMAPRVPPVTTTSPVVPSQEKLEPGSSENVKVMLAVSPVFKVDTLLVRLTEGAKVSKLMLGAVPALPLLPAVSV